MNLKIIMLFERSRASQVTLVVKNPSANAGDVKDSGSIPGLGRSPRGGHGNPFQYSYLENPCGQRSLVGYSPWGCKESDMTEHLSTSTKPKFKKRVHIYIKLYREQTNLW